MHVTGCHHLLSSHFLVSNTVARATVAHLPVDHVLRRLLSPFLFRTTYVNNRALGALIPENSLFHHATALEYEGVNQLFAICASESHIWQPFPQFSRGFGLRLNLLARNGSFPLISDGLLLHQDIDELVSSWLSNAFLDDRRIEDAVTVAFYEELVNQTAHLAYKLPPLINGRLTPGMLRDAITQFIWVVTGFHELVGSLSEYLVPTGSRLDGTHFRAPVHVPPGAAPADLEAMLVALSILSTTSLRMPKLRSELPNYFLAKDWQHKRWGEFQARLGVLQERLSRANHVRTGGGLPPFVAFQPDLLDISISL